MTSLQPISTQTNPDPFDMTSLQPSLTKSISDPFGMDSFEKVIQPLIPVPQPRLKANQKLIANKDLQMLGDPGTPPPPPPIKPQNYINTRPSTLNFNTVDSATDFDLLGNPGILTLKFFYLKNKKLINLYLRNSTNPTTYCFSIIFLVNLISLLLNIDFKFYQLM